MLKQRIGQLNYPVESIESRLLLEESGISELMEQIESEKQEAFYRSVDSSSRSSPKRDKFFESRKFEGIVRDMGEEDVMRSISNAEEIYLDKDEIELENFQT